MTAKQSATGSVSVTSWITSAGRRARAAGTSPRPSSCRRGRARPRRGYGAAGPAARPSRSAGSANADQTSSSPIPTPSPTTAPISASPSSSKTSIPSRSNRSRRGGSPAAAPQLAADVLEDRLGLDDVGLDPAGHRHDLLDAPHCRAGRDRGGRPGRHWRPPSARRSGRRCSRPRAAAACTSSPAPRARELAWIVHMPGSPALSASSRSMHSSARTSPTSSRLGRIRRLSFTRSRSVISPVPSSPDCRVCIGTQSGCGKRSSKTSSTVTTRSPPGMAAARQLRKVVLPL